MEPNWSPVAANPDPVEGTRSVIGFDPEKRSLESIVMDLENSGYLTSSAGKLVELNSYENEWAQLNWYTWRRVYFDLSNFVLRTNAKWEYASDIANWWDSGCGFVFREKDVDNHYLVHLDMDGIARLTRVKHGYHNRIGVSGDRYPVVKPADSANLMLVAEGYDIRFFVNGLEMLYRQDMGHDSGDLGLTLLSGTNKDFGTRCSLTDVELWILDD
jgi:hypothetical protein